MASQRVELTGEYRGPIWKKPDGTFLIGSLLDGTTVMGPVQSSMNGSPSPDSGRNDLIPGIEYRFIGRWEKHPSHGEQFKFEGFVRSEPKSHRGVIEYLSKTLDHCGIGRMTAHRITDRYGPQHALRMMKDHPETIAADFKNVPLEKAREAARQLLQAEKFEETKVELIEVFSGRGFPGTIIESCVNRWGVMAPRRVKRDPLSLLVNKMPGCGFARVDALYSALGLPPNRLKRQVICLWHAMRSDMSGSVWFSAEWLERQLMERVSGEVKFADAVKLGVKARWFGTVRGKDGRVLVACAEDANAERGVSEELRRLVG